MQYYGKHLPAALLGKHGYIQQLLAYQLMRNDCPAHLREYIEQIDTAIDSVEPAEDRAVLVNIYRNGRTPYQTQYDLGRSLHWVKLHHAIAVNTYGMAIDFEMGNYTLSYGKHGGLVVTPSDHVPLPRPPVDEVAAAINRAEMELNGYDATR